MRSRSTKRESTDEDALAEIQRIARFYGRDVDFIMSRLAESETLGEYFENLFSK